MISARVTDAAALAARTPAELSAYLRARGWDLASRTPSGATWTHELDGQEVEILQPLDHELRDYPLRVADALATLAAFEGRSELDVLRDMSAATWDVHTLRMFPADEPAGMIGMEDGVLAMESLRGLVSAAAYPIFSQRSRAVQPARRPQGLVDFLRGVRIRPATEGSFILTAHTPVPPRLAMQTSLFDDSTPEHSDEPVERRVSLAIYRAVRVASSAADAALLTDDGLQPFTDAVEDGLSANLCEALAGSGGASGHPFEFSLSMAVTRQAGALAPIRFARHHLPLLREAASELRARTPEENVTIIGDVVRLHREATAGGEITLVGRVDDADTLRRIWVELAGDDYSVAMDAHVRTRQVSLTGNLSRRGTRFYLTNHSGLQIVAESLSE